MQWSGRLLVRRSDLKATPTKSAGNSSQIGQPLVGLVAICKPLHTTPVREIHMDGNMFIGRKLVGERRVCPHKRGACGLDPMTA